MVMEFLNFEFHGGSCRENTRFVGRSGNLNVEIAGIALVALREHKCTLRRGALCSKGIYCVAKCQILVPGLRNMHTNRHAHAKDLVLAVESNCQRVQSDSFDGPAVSVLVTRRLKTVQEGNAIITVNPIPIHTLPKQIAKFSLFPACVLCSTIENLGFLGRIGDDDRVGASVLLGQMDPLANELRRGVLKVPLQMEPRPWRIGLGSLQHHPDGLAPRRPGPMLHSGGVIPAVLLCRRGV